MEQDNLEFDFEQDVHNDFQDELQRAPPTMPVGEIGQQPRNFVKNYKKTVCAFWIKGMCMKGDNCGFLHEMIPERMPECQTFLKKGYCPEPDCPFKHTRENIKECNMYALGFCIFGPECRYNHTRKPGPPPDPSTVEAAKPKMFRDINRVVNAVNQDVAGENEGAAGPAKRQRVEITTQTKPLPISQFPAGSRPQQRPGGRHPLGAPMRPGGNNSHMPRLPSGRGPMLPRPPPGAPHQGRPQMHHNRAPMHQQGNIMGGGQNRGGPGSFHHMPRPPQQPPPSGGMVPMAPRPHLQQQQQNMAVLPGTGLQPPRPQQSYPPPGWPDQQQQQMPPGRQQFVPY